MKTEDLNQGDRVTFHGSGYVQHVHSNGRADVKWDAGDSGNSMEISLLKPERQSNLVEHARRELDLLGEEESIILGYLEMIQIFADMGHSGGSASVFVPTLNRLMRFENLKPLTDDPDEWFFHGEDTSGHPEGMWQNRRNGEAFSHDGGKTYYLLSERVIDEDRFGTKSIEYTHHESEKSA